MPFGVVVKLHLAAVLFVTSLILCAVAVTMMSPRMCDFDTVFYPAANDWVSGRYALYDGSYGFFGLPWLLGIIIPFAAFPLSVSHVMWIAFTLLCIIVSVRCCGKFPLYVAALAILNQPMLLMLANGQIDAIPLLGVSISFLAAKRRNLALLSVGLFLVATKPPNLILVSILLLLERWSWRALFLPIVAYFVSGLFIGMDWPYRYILTIQNNPPAIGPQTVLWRSPIPTPIIAVVALVSLIYFGIAIKHDGLTPKTFSLALSANMAYSVYALSAHYVMLIPAFLLLAKNWRIAVLLYIATWSLVLFPFGTWVGVFYPLCLQVVAFADKGIAESATIHAPLKG